MSCHWSDWQKTTTVFRWTRGHLAMPECCYCRVPASETVAKHWVVDPGTPIEEIGYVSPSPRVQCAPNKGCNAKPWMRQGMHLREGSWDGPPPFKRVRDGRYFGFAE